MPQPAGDVPPSETFDAIFEANYADIYRYAARRCASVEDAEDLVAETFMVAWRRLGELPPSEETRLWLFGTARLVLRNQRRTTGRQHRLLVRLRSLAGSPPAEDLASRLASRSQVGRALAELPAADREVLLLAGWEGLASEEIAQVLGLSPAAARKRLQRARDRLRQRLEAGSTPAHQLLTEET